MKFNMKSGVFSKFIISYIIVLIIPVLLISYQVYGKFVNILTNEVTNSTKDMLYQIRDVVDVRLQEMVDITSLVSMNSKISPLISRSIFKNDNAYPDVYDCIKELRNYKNANGFIDHIFLTFKNNDIVVSDLSKDSFDSVFGSSYIFRGVSSKQLYDKLSRLQGNSIMPSAVVEKNGYTMNIITYMQPLPINSSTHTASLLITMKESMFRTLIRNVLNDYNGSVYILDSGRNIISSTDLGNTIMEESEVKDFIKSVNGNKVNSYSEVKKGCIMSYVMSSLTGWSYVAVIPSAQILEKVNYVTKRSIQIFCISLFIGLLLAYSFSRGNYVNIRKITDIILSYKHNGSESKYKNEWELINEAIYNYINENKSLQQKLTDQMPVLRNNFYMCLLNGEFNNNDTVNSMREFLKIEMRYQFYAVLLLAVDNCKKFAENHAEPTQGVIKIALYNAAEEICSEIGRGYAVEVSRYNIAVIVGLSQTGDGRMKMLKDSADKIRSYVVQNFDFTITAGVSDIHNDILEIKDAYNEACSAIDYRMIYGENSVICYYDGRNRVNNRYFYSFKQQSLIISYLRAGDFSSIKELLEDIVTSVKNEAVSLNIVKCIYLEIVNTALKASDELAIDSEVIEQNLPSLVQQETLDGVCKEVNKFYMIVCEHIQKARSGKNSRLIRKVLEFIDKNYFDKSLSVESLADEFSVSPSYMSRFFKEQRNCNFTDYLHNIRLSKAKWLLAKSERTIAEIADEVGYNSIHNFTRVFKRYENITPTEYKLSELSKSNLSQI